MSNFKIEEKGTFRFVGFKTKLEGSERIHSELFSSQKTEFFKDILQSGKMGLLKQIAKSNLGIQQTQKTKYGYPYILNSFSKVGNCRITRDMTNSMSRVILSKSTFFFLYFSRMLWPSYTG
jgi:hypothetical protein